MLNLSTLPQFVCHVTPLANAATGFPGSEVTKSFIISHTCLCRRWWGAGPRLEAGREWGSAEGEGRAREQRSRAQKGGGGFASWEPRAPPAAWSLSETALCLDGPCLFMRTSPSKSLFLQPDNS